MYFLLSLANCLMFKLALEEARFSSKDKSNRQYLNDLNFKSGQRLNEQVLQVAFARSAQAKEAWATTATLEGAGPTPPDQFH